jgi:WD40 repeat protein
MFHELKSLHMEEVNSLETHPTDSRLLLSASDDGNIILWNILTGRLIKKILNWVIIFFSFGSSG